MPRVYVWDETFYDQPMIGQVLADIAGDVPSYTKKIPFYILVLVSLTASSTWRLVRSKSLAPLALHINQICVTVVGHLIDLGLMGQLKAVLLTGTSSIKRFPYSLRS